ncbi:polyprenyl diphosphate synthase [Micromonospora humi]|uniref:Isoprenyl transferase n=1 Tax=Micromonospora humi TaxID=745366 RepID=A0A1C5K2B8_9ACTN|nr:polyprenyl diphosphate synthase [Micromonospora humi]SCG76888.1 Undecaprenyl pyrophosphate synthetase [Micromonospora humi]
MTVLTDLVRRLHARRLRARLVGAALPRHVAMVMDGNRRWARQMGFDDPSVGHRYGAAHLHEVAGWCAELGIRQITLFVASVDNVRKRESGEVAHLMRLVEEVIAEPLLRPDSPWRLHVAGRTEVLPESTRHALKLAEDATRDRDRGFHLTVAIGYDGRVEITDAVRNLLHEAAENGVTLREVADHLTEEAIGAHLYTGSRPHPDLVIRTSGERRMSGFLLWQAVHSELYFCDVYWPGFRKLDFLRALRTYTTRP